MRIPFKVLGLCAVLVCSSAQSAWGQADENAKLVEGAKKEGKLVWYTSTNVTESKPLLDDFEKVYPFVKGEIVRASGERTLNRIVTEVRANRSEFDIVTISEVDALIQAKLLAPYRSPEAKSFIPEFKDPNSYWTAIYINYATIGYNPTLVSEKEAPKQWEDLLDPKWKGKFAIDQEQYPWYGTLHKAWGRERAQKYMRALTKQGIQWRKGHTLIAQLMAAGEFPLGVVYATHRRDETTRCAGGMGEHGQSDRRHRERRGPQYQTATSQYGEAILRLSYVQTGATALAHAAPNPGATRHRTLFSKNGAIQVEAAS